MSIVLFILGLLLGLWWSTVIPLPLFYGFPCDSIWVLRGAVRPRAALRYLIGILFWTVLFTGFAIIWPAAARYLVADAAFSYGS